MNFLLEKYKAKLENDNLNTAARAVIMDIVKDLEMVQAESEALDQYFEDVSNSL
ncbi:MAG: hypothetical protein RR191_05415 [Cetobacterium sp.]|uniref:hypothetical protein n=1 Tax=Cetobacterium sp. TaxID=2071632 RepID=UPI002FC9D3D4